MESCNLPMELLIDIMLRLPVKSLMRFKSVCKFFYNLIKRDHHFIHKHYEINRLKRSHVVRESGNRMKQFNLLSIESESNEIECTYLDVEIEKTRYIKCCRGMLCLILGGGRPNKDYSAEDLPVYDILIWNPTTREVKPLLSVTVPYKPSNKQAMWKLDEQFGFGVSNNMTWKIVVLWRIQDYNVLESTPLVKWGQIHGIAMICSQVGDSWSWRQIDEVPRFILDTTQDFYLKGRYYWRIRNAPLPKKRPQLLWFDMDDEVFGTLEFEFPSSVAAGTVLVTTMNETIALLSFLNRRNLENDYNIEIWLMDEINGNINWYKQASIDCGTSIDHHEHWSPKGPLSEIWKPIGIWNLDKHYLLVFPSVAGFRDVDDEDTYVPYLISIDLATQERKMIYKTQERKSIYFVPKSIGYVQVYNEGDIHITNEWRGLTPFAQNCMYARVYHESLYSL